jgi:hypothetical protein
MSKKFAILLGVLAFMLSGSSAFADVIDFETFSGPTTFCSSPNTLHISTSIGTVVASGGTVLTDATNAPADETSVYATAARCGLSNTLTLTFPENINNFFLDVFNGQTYPDTFTVSDNVGNSTTVIIDSNTNSGVSLVSFPAAGSIVTITTPDTNWDFFIDNVGFDQPTPGTTPEPVSLVLLGTGLAAIGSKLRAPRQQAS